MLEIKFEVFLKHFVHFWEFFGRNEDGKKISQDIAITAASPGRLKTELAQSSGNFATDLSAFVI